MKKIYIFPILLTFFTFGCGFKVINKSELGNFDIAEINTTGEKRINFKLKNKLLFNSTKNDNKLIKIDLNTKKIKNAKEKNIKNEITKYEISIIVDVKFSLIQKVGNVEFVVEDGSFLQAQRLLNPISFLIHLIQKRLHFLVSTTFLGHRVLLEQFALTFSPSGEDTLVDPSLQHLVTILGVQSRKSIPLTLSPKVSL